MTGRTDLKEDETTGLAFSPDAKHMYVSYQGESTDNVVLQLSSLLLQRPQGACAIDLNLNIYRRRMDIRLYTR